MRILVISQFYKPDITAAAFRITDFVDYLTKAGHDVFVITSYPHKTEVENYDFSKEKEIRRVKIKEVKKKGFSGYVSHYFSFMFKSMWCAWKNRKWGYDLIFVSSPPLFVGYGGIWLKRILRKTIFMEIRDIWPDTAVAAGQLRNGSLPYKLASHVEKVIYKKSSKIAAVSEPMAKYIEGIRGSNVSICYNGVKQQEIASMKTLERHNLSDEITIAYLGNIGLCQGVDDLVELSRLILKSKRKIKIRLIGGGPEKESLQAKVKDYGTNKVVSFEGPFPREKIENIVSNDIDILFLNLKDHPVFHKTIPSKVFDYLLYKRPIVFGIKGEGEDIINQLEAGIGYRSGDIESLMESLNLIISDYEKYIKNCERKNLDLLKEKFTREGNFSSYLKEFRELVDN